MAHRIDYLRQKKFPYFALRWWPWGWYSYWPLIYSHTVAEAPRHLS